MPHTTQSATAAGRNTYALAWAATLLFFAGFYTLLAPLPRYLADVGLPDWQIGLVLGAFGVASLLARPAAGVAVDRWGARRVMLVGAGALLAGSAGVVGATGVALLFGLCLLQAAGYVAFSTAGVALVVLLTPPDMRGRRLAIFGAAANVAITLAPAATAALLSVAPLATGFWLAAGLALAAGILAAALPGASTMPAVGRPIAWGFPRQLWLPMLLTGLFGAGFAAFFQFAPILAERRGTIDAGALYTIYGVGIIMCRIFGGGWIDRASFTHILALAAALMGCGLALAAFVASPVLLGLAAFLTAVGGGLFHPTLLAHHAALLPDQPGRASAACYVGMDLGIGLGSWIFGAALQVAGVTGLYGAATVLVLLTLPMLVGYRDNNDTMTR
jgi:predicted MFS family arabinose efflux permease